MTHRRTTTPTADRFGFDCGSLDEARTRLALLADVRASDIVIEPRTATVFRWAACGTTLHGRCTVVSTPDGSRLHVSTPDAARLQGDA